MEKHDRQKYKRKKERQCTGKAFLFRKKRSCIIKVFLYRTACFGRLTTLSSLAAGQRVVSQTPRGWRLVKCLRCCCRPSRLLVELAAEYTPPWIVSKYTPAPGLCNLNSKTHPYWLQTRKFLPGVLTPYQSQATTAAFRVHLIPYRPRRVAAMYRTRRRGDVSHSDDEGCERMISIRKPSTSTFICRLNSSGV